MGNRWVWAPTLNTVTLSTADDAEQHDCIAELIALTESCKLGLDKKVTTLIVSMPSQLCLFLLNNRRIEE